MMKTSATHKLILIPFAVVGLLLLTVSAFAQQKPDEQTSGKKTITVHVTKVDGDQTIVIDTTVVTDGDFDADAFLEEKGVKVDASGKEKNIEKQIIIRHPGNEDMEWSESEDDSPDTIIIHTDREFAFNDQHPPLPPDMPYELYWHENPQEFPLLKGPQFEDMFEGLARSLGLEDVMPFGDMKQVVVKKKRNGKKMIITFEDRDKASGEHSRKQEEKVIILKDTNTGIAPGHEKRIIVQTDPGEGMMHEKGTPAKKETKVIIIKEEKPK